MHDTIKEYVSSTVLNFAEIVRRYDGCIDPLDDFEKDDNDALLSGQDKVSDASEWVASWSNRSQILLSSSLFGR